MHRHLDFCMDKKVLFSQAGLLTHGSSFDCTFPLLITEQWFKSSRRPRLQRWPNVTEFHRFPFSREGKSLKHLVDMYILRGHNTRGV